MERIVDMHLPRTMEQIIESIKVLLQEWISLKFCEQIVGVPVPQAVEQLISTQDKIHDELWSRPGMNLD